MSSFVDLLIVEILSKCVCLMCSVVWSLFVTAIVLSILDIKWQKVLTQTFF